MGDEAARPYVDRAAPKHPSLLDVGHLVDERFGVVNIPNSVWIDEAGTIVRPAEPAWPDSGPAPQAQSPSPDLPPGRLGEMRRTHTIVRRVRGRESRATVIKADELESGANRVPGKLLHLVES